MLILLSVLPVCFSKGVFILYQWSVNFSYDWYNSTDDCWLLTVDWWLLSRMSGLHLECGSLTKTFLYEQYSCNWNPVVLLSIMLYKPVLSLEFVDASHHHSYENLWACRQRFYSGTYINSSTTHTTIYNRILILGNRNVKCFSENLVDTEPLL